MQYIDIFRCVVAFLHACGAICSVVLCFTCEGAKIRQNWMIPSYASSLTGNCTNTTGECFRMNQDWNDYTVLSGYFFNPYVLIMIFQWITAAFSLFHTRHLRDGITIICDSWYLDLFSFYP